MLPIFRAFGVKEVVNPQGDPARQERFFPDDSDSGTNRSAQVPPFSLTMTQYLVPPNVDPFYFAKGERGGYSVGRGCAIFPSSDRLTPTRRARKSRRKKVRYKKIAKNHNVRKKKP